MTGPHPSLSGTTWTCFGCDHEQPDTEDMPQYCPTCGGVWVRPVELTSWQVVRDRIRRRFSRTQTFDSAEEMIAWLESR